MPTIPSTHGLIFIISLVVVASIITVFALFLFWRAWLQNGRRNPSLAQFLMVDTLRIDPAPTTFSADHFQRLIAHEGLLPAILYYEDFFKESLSIFAFTREQLRTIACATCISKNSSAVFPLYLRQHVISMIVKSVMSLEEAITEHGHLKTCCCIDKDHSLDAMVRRFIKTTEDCDMVIRMIPSQYSIHTTAVQMKERLMSKVTALN